MNGSVSKVKRHDKQFIQPGCEIIIPTKDETRITWAQIAQVGTSVVSMASVVALLVNTLSK
jgi:hypothetical protein